MKNNDITKRIETIIKDLGGKIINLSDSLGVNHSVVTEWIKKGSIPGGKHLMAFSEKLNININWLLTGKGPKMADKVKGSRDGLTIIKAEEKIFLDLFRDADKIARSAAISLMEKRKPAPAKPRKTVPGIKFSYEHDATEYEEKLPCRVCGKDMKNFVITGEIMGGSGDLESINRCVECYSIVAKGGYYLPHAEASFTPRIIPRDFPINGGYLQIEHSDCIYDTHGHNPDMRIIGMYIDQQSQHPDDNDQSVPETHHQIPDLWRRIVLVFECRECREEQIIKFSGNVWDGDIKINHHKSGPAPDKPKTTLLSLINRQASQNQWQLQNELADKYSKASKEIRAGIKTMLKLTKEPEPQSQLWDTVTDKSSQENLVLGFLLCRREQQRELDPKLRVPLMNRTEQIWEWLESNGYFNIENINA